MGFADSAALYAFADIGFGIDHATDKSATLGGVGAGLDYSLGDHLQANFIAGVALRCGRESRTATSGLAEKRKQAPGWRNPEVAGSRPDRVRLI